MSRNPLVETVKRVWVDNERVFLEVRPYPEAPETSIEIATTTPQADQWFGKTSLTMSPEYARALGESLIAMADEFKK